MKRYLLFLIAALIFSDVCSVHAGKERRPLIITSLPVTTLLTSHLTAGTEIETTLVIPSSYSVGAQKNYFKKNRNFAEQAAGAAACITIAAAWKEDSLYPFARRHNIHIVEIDAAAPKDRSRTGGVLLTGQGTNRISPYIWRSPANLTRMAEFICRDLQQLFPQYATELKNNLLTLQRQIFQLRTRCEIALSEKEGGAVAALTDAFDYLTSEFGIEVDRYFLKEEIDWTEKDYSNFTSYLKENGITVVLCNRPPRENIAKAIADAGAAPVILKTLLTQQKEKAAPLEIFTDFYSYNLTAIVKAMK